MQLHLRPFGDGSTLTLSSSFETREVVSADAGSFQRRPPLATLNLTGSPSEAEIIKPRSIKRTPIFCHVVRGARQTGFRLIANSEGLMAFEEILPDVEACENYLAKLSTPGNPFLNENADVRRDGNRYYSDRLDHATMEYSGKILGLFSAEPSNYGSWLFRVIPKLAVADLIGLRDYKIACWCPRPFQRQLLDFFGIPESRIIDVQMTWSCLYEELFVPTCLNPEAYLNETTLNFIRTTLRKRGIVQERRRLLYISRMSHARSRAYTNVRHFTDEAKLVDILSARGFEIVEPEKLTVREQIELFASAACIVGASGAAMFNTIFCAPGTLVYDIEAFPYWIHAHANYFSSCGHNYMIAFGSPDENDPNTHRRWTIDVDAVAGQIEAAVQLATM